MVCEAAKDLTYSGVIVVRVAVLGHAITFCELPCSICGITWVNVAAHLFLRE